MQSIDALSLAPHARDWLAISHHPRILHVFDQVCNLINERREVLSLVTVQIGNGPFNLVVEGHVDFSSHLDADSSISICAGELHLGGLIVNTDKASPWSPRPDWRRLHAAKEKILSQLALSPMINRQPLLPGSLTNAFSAALANADIDSALGTAPGLAGLGQGLTPAGDDFILGAILGAWIIHPPEIARLIAEEVTKTAVPLTTSLSAAWLRSAGRGEAGILWHNFLDALLNTDTARAQAAADGILAIGETSGADALSGFIGTFISFGSQRKNHVLPRYLC